MPNGGKISIIIEAIDRTRAAFASASRSLEGIADRAGRLGRALSLKVTAPLTLAGAMALRTATQFDKAATEVRAIAKAAGATAQDLNSLTKMAVDFGRKGVFGPTEVMRAMIDMVRDGMKPAEIAGGRLKGVYDMAAAGAIDMATAQIILSDTMMAYGATVEETTRYVDALVGVTLETPAVMADLAETMKYVAPVAAGLNVSIEELSGMMGILAEVGIRGSLAGTALRRSFIALGAPSTAAIELMEELGIQVWDQTGKLRSMTEVVAEVARGIEGMTEQQKLATLETIFGARAVTAWMALVEAGPEALAAMTAAVSQQGRAEKVATEMTKGLSASLSKLKALWETLAAEVLPLLTKGMEKVVAIVKPLIEKFMALSPKAKMVIVVLLALAAAIGPLLLMIGALSAAIAAISAPIMIAVAAIGALVAAGVALYMKWDEVKKFFIDTWEGLKIMFEEGVESIKSFIDSLVDRFWAFIDFLRGLPGKIWDAIKTIPEKIKSAFTFKLPHIRVRIEEWKPPIGPAIPVPRFSIEWLQRGGIVKKPTLAKLGEAGPEAVIPLKRGGGAAIVINIYGNTFMSDREAAEKIGDMIIDKLKFELKL